MAAGVCAGVRACVCVYRVRKKHSAEISNHYSMSATGAGEKVPFGRPHERFLC